MSSKIAHSHSFASVSLTAACFTRHSLARQSFSRKCLIAYSSSRGFATKQVFANSPWRAIVLARPHLLCTAAVSTRQPGG
eukprot:scaffold112219_cov27-Tisochrysis_lutea.AAC.3